MNPSYDNSFDSFGAGGAVPGGFSSSPAGGDIVLGGTPKKKSKKFLIIAVIVGFAVLVLIGIVMMLQNNTSVNLSANSKEDFYAYANYLLYRVDSTADIVGDYDVSEVYALNEVEGMNSSTKKAFFLNAEERLNKFESSLDGNVAQSFRDRVNKYKESFVLAKMTLTLPTLDNSEFINAYLTYDANDLRSWINSRFSEFTKSNYALVKTFGEKAIEYYTVYATYLDEAKIAGCINETNQIVDCEEVENETLMERMDDAYEELIEMQSEALDDTLTGCFTIVRVMNGEKAEEGDEQ